MTGTQLILRGDPAERRRVVRHLQRAADQKLYLTLNQRVRVW